MSKVIQKENWVSQFTLIGKAKVGDFTFKIDEKSEKSNWIYNSLNLGVDCGENHGIVYSELMGGYSADGGSTIYAHGKDEKDNDDFKTKINVDWDDRFNPEILENIGRTCFIRVGLEKTDKDNTFYKDFLSAYDAIAYVKEHLEDGMVINVKGKLLYSLYNDNLQVKKTITSIVLSKAEPDKYAARFTQTVLIDEDSASLKADNIDKDKSIMYVNARVLDYVKEMNGKEVKGQYPFNKQFEFKMPLDKPEMCKKIFDKLFKVKKDTITQITFEGDFVESGAAVNVTLDDVPDDIKELVKLGLYTEEEAISRCTDNRSRERRMVLLKPTTKKVEDEDNQVAVVQVFPEQYKEEDLVLDCLMEDEEVPFEEGNESSSDNMDWLNSL